MKILGYEITLKKVAKEEPFVETAESLYGHIEALSRVTSGWNELEATKEVYEGVLNLAKQDYIDCSSTDEEIEEGEMFYTFEVVKRVNGKVYFRVQ